MWTSFGMSCQQILSKVLYKLCKDHDNLIQTYAAGLSVDSEGKAAMYAVNELIDFSNSDMKTKSFQ